MSTYSTLLTQLITASNSELKLKVSVSDAALRQGLQLAINKHNEGMEILELPTLDRQLSVSKKDSKGVITIRLKDSAPTELSFTIIEDDGDSP